LSEVVEEKGWKEVTVKNRVGATAYGAWTWKEGQPIPEKVLARSFDSTHHAANNSRRGRICISLLSRKLESHNLQKGCGWWGVHLCPNGIPRHRK
jgi:hypothetical protein